MSKYAKRSRLVSEANSFIELTCKLQAHKLYHPNRKTLITTTQRAWSTYNNVKISDKLNSICVIICEILLCLRRAVVLLCVFEANVWHWIKSNNNWKVLKLTLTLLLD